MRSTMYVMVTYARQVIALLFWVTRVMLRSMETLPLPDDVPSKCTDRINLDKAEDQNRILSTSWNPLYFIRAWINTRQNAQALVRQLTETTGIIGLHTKQCLPVGSFLPYAARQFINDGCMDYFPAWLSVRVSSPIIVHWSELHYPPRRSHTPQSRRQIADFFRNTPLWIWQSSSERYCRLARIAATVNVRTVCICGKFFLQTTRVVPAQAELLTYYGMGYWHNEFVTALVTTPWWSSKDDIQQTPFYQYLTQHYRAHDTCSQAEYAELRTHLSRDDL